MQLYLGVRTNRLWRWVAATVVAGLAVLGYAVWIPVRHPDPAKVARLALTAPLEGFRHRHGAESAAADSTFAAVKSAAAATAGETAVYTVTWKGASKKSAAALVVVALPSTRDAAATRQEAKKAYLSQTSLTAEGYGYIGALRLPAVPGAQGATFAAGTSPTPTPTTRRTDAELFSVGRLVVVATSEGTGAPAKAAVDALAVAEYRYLRHTGGRPRLAETSFPLVASLVYAAVAAAVLVAVQLAPWVRTTVRRRRQAAWEAALRRERTSRGSKVVKRQAGRPGPGRSGPRRPAGSGRARR